MLATGARLAVGPAGGTMGAGRGSMAAQLWNREAASRTHRRPAAADGCGDCAGPGRQLCRRALAQGCATRGRPAVRAAEKPQTSSVSPRLRVEGFALGAHIKVSACLDKRGLAQI